MDPIVIFDEPQNLETDNRKLAIARLAPMCTLRYSATHRNAYNLIHSLDPVQLELGRVLGESGRAMSHAYFPVNAIVSLLYVMEDGASAEIAVVGSEGMVGV